MGFNSGFKGLIQCFLIAQHVLGDTPSIIRSSKAVIAASGFYIRFCLPVAAAMTEPSQRQPATKNVCTRETRGCNYSF